MNFTIRAVRDGITTELAPAGPTLFRCQSASVSESHVDRGHHRCRWNLVFTIGVDQLLSFDRPRAGQLKSGNDVQDVVSDILKTRIE